MNENKGSDQRPASKSTVSGDAASVLRVDAASSIESVEPSDPPPSEAVAAFNSEVFSRGKGFLATLLRNFPNGSVAVLDTDLCYLFIEGQGLGQVGLSSASLLHKTAFEFLPGEVARVLDSHYRRALAGDEVAFDVSVFGNVYHVRAAPLPGGDGSIPAILVVSQNVTREKRAEAALQENEARLSGILGGLHDLVWSFSADTFDLLYANPAFDIAFGRPAAEFFQNPRLWASVIHEDDQQKRANAMAQVLTQGKMECMMRIYRPSREVRYLYERATLTHDPVTRQPVRIDVVATDITESRQAQIEHEQLASIVEFTDDAIISKNMDGIILSWNAGAEKMYGYRADEVIGKSLALLIPPESTGDLEWILYSIRAGRPIIQHEMTRLRKDGQRIIVSHTISPVRSADGTLLGASTISRDITQMRIAQNALRESEEKFRTLANNLPDIITRFDLDGRHLYINRAIEPITQKSVMDYLGRTNAELDMPAPLVTLWSDIALKARQTGRQQQIPFAFETPHGVRHFDSSLVPEFGMDGKTVVSLLGVTRDVTEAKNAEAELRRQKGLLESQTEASLDGILTVSTERRIIAYNRRFVELWNIDEALLRADTDTFALQYLTDQVVGGGEFFKARAEYLSAHLNVESSSVIHLKSGRSLEVRSAPAKGEDGTFYGRIIFFRDVTEREEMEATLRASEERFRALTEHSTDVISVLDPDGIARYDSPSVTAVLGYLPGEIAGTDTATRVHPDDLPILTETFQSLGAGKSIAAPLLLRYRHKNGEWRWLEISGSNQIGNPAIGGFVINSRDVTERVELQKQLIQNEKLAAFGELVAGVAHEIDNPLTAISGYAQLMRNHADETVREDAAVIEAMVQRSTRILRSLRSYARPSGEARTMGQLNAVVQSALDVVTHRMRQASVSLVLDLANDLPLLRMNTGEIEQVVVNLLANAEYALRGRPDDQKTIRLTTRAAPQDSNDGQAETTVCVLEVADTGIGISEAVRGRIFDPFFSTRNNKEGTGLGLYISHGIITSHGGTIMVRSREGEGTTFTISLPINTGEVEQKKQAAPDGEETK